MQQIFAGIVSEVEVVAADGCNVFPVFRDPKVLRQSGGEKVQAFADYVSALQTKFGGFYAFFGGGVINGAVAYRFKLTAPAAVKNHAVNRVGEFGAGNTV